MECNILNAEIILGSGEHVVSEFQKTNLLVGENSVSVLKALAEVSCGAFNESRNMRIVNFDFFFDEQLYRISATAMSDEPMKVFATYAEDDDQTLNDLALFEYKGLIIDFSLNSANSFFNKQSYLSDAKDEELTEKKWAEFVELLVRDTALGDTRPIFVYDGDSVSADMLAQLDRLDRQVFVAATKKDYEEGSFEKIIKIKKVWKVFSML